MPRIETLAVHAGREGLHAGAIRQIGELRRTLDRAVPDQQVEAGQSVEAFGQPCMSVRQRRRTGGRGEPARGQRAARARLRSNTPPQRCSAATAS